MTDDSAAAQLGITADALARLMVTSGEAIVGYIVVGDYPLAVQTATDLAAAGRDWQQRRFEQAVGGEQP